MSKVSALVSAYYAEPYLEGRLANLHSQGGVELEVVVVCQQDSREQHIAQQVLKDSDQIVLTPDIPTVYRAWNLAIEKSTGDYLTNANSDDRHLDGGLRKLADALDAHPSSALAYSNIERVTAIDGPQEGVFEFMSGGLKELYFKGCFLGPMPMWRRTLHNVYGYFDEEYTVAGDYEFWLRLAASKERFFKVDEVLGRHLERLDALEHRSIVKTTWETARAKSKYRNIIDPEIKPVLRKEKS